MDQPALEAHQLIDRLPIAVPPEASAGVVGA